MSAAGLPAAQQGVDRRDLLRAGLLGAGALGLAATLDAGPSLLQLVGDALPTTAALPAAATWEALLGEELTLVTTGGAVTGQVVDVRDVAHAAGSVPLEGDAYSLLLHAPALPDAPSHVVTVLHPSLARPALVVVPVNGDDSWEATVDRRTPSRPS